jgi:hypothetical protein
MYNGTSNDQSSKVFIKPRRFFDASISFESLKLSLLGFLSPLLYSYSKKTINCKFFFIFREYAQDLLHV